MKSIHLAYAFACGMTSQQRRIDAAGVAPARAVDDLAEPSVT